MTGCVGCTRETTCRDANYKYLRGCADKTIKTMQLQQIPPRKPFKVKITPEGNLKYS